MWPWNLNRISAKTKSQSPVSRITGSSGPPPLTRDSPSCLKIESNITSYSVRPYRIPRRRAFSSHLETPTVQGVRAMSHEIAWLVRDETKNALRFPALRSRFPIRQAREWRFSMAGVAWRSLGPDGRDFSALVVDGYSHIYVGRYQPQASP